MAIDPLRDAYDAVVRVEVDLPRVWRGAPPSRIPGNSAVVTPKEPMPILRYQIACGGTTPFQGRVPLDLPSCPPPDGYNTDQAFGAAAEQLAIRVVHDLTAMSNVRPNPV